MIWNFCIRRPVLTIVIFLAIAVFGIFGYSQMPVREYPDIDFPIVSVSVVLPGADPEVIETEVVEPLEEELNTIEGISEITSTSQEQVGTVTVEFELDRDIDIAAQDVRDRLSRARPDMAEDIEEPVVRKIDPDARAILWFALTGDERWDLVRLTEYADTRIKERLEGMPGVGQIQIGGERRYAVRIRLDPQKLAALDLTVQQVVETIQDENVDIPSGRVTSERREFLIKTEGQFSSAQPFNDLILAYREGSPVRLADVGEAVDGFENERTLARFRGETSVGLGIVKQSDANMVELAEEVRQRMEKLSRGFPPGLSYSLASDDSRYVEASIRDLRYTILLATLLVVIVILLFLGTARGTFITTVAIPTSLLGGFAAIYYFGFSLNMLTMLGLILAIGILVDDAIVVLESCYRHMEQGAEPTPAARTGTTEIAFAAIANTLSLAAVFIPVAFMPGLIGRFFFEFGLTVTLTVFFSTFTALTLTPMLCSRLLRPPEQERKNRVQIRVEKGLERFEKAYRRTLAAALDHRWITLGIGVATFIAGIWIFTLLETEFTPRVDREQFIISFETPEGASLQATNLQAGEIEEILEDMEEVKSFFMAIGLSGAGPGKVNEGIVFVRLTSTSERQRSQQDIMQQVRRQIGAIAGVRAYVMEGGGPVQAEAPLQVVLKNPSLGTLARQQEDVLEWMRDQELFVGVRSNMQLDKPEVRVRVNRDQAGEMNVQVATISNALRYIFGEPTISTIDQESERYDVITEIAQKVNVPSTIYSLYVRNEEDQMVSLANLVDLEEGIGPSEIHHFNRTRAVTISADTPPDVPLGTALDALQEFLDRTLPPEMETEVTGEAQDFRESFFYLAITLLFSILFIYLVLAAQFESFLHPFTIMATLPLAGIGAFGGLLLFGMTFNIFSFIGLIMLVGLVTKTGILLVDYANVLAARGATIREAAQQAGETRFRPVLMTASSTILGMLPIALGFGAGGTGRAPLGVAVAVGNLASTALTLLVIPVLYVLMNDLHEVISRHRRLGLAVAAGLLVAIGALVAWRYL